MTSAKSMATVGLYITKDAVTVAQVKRTLHGPRLTKSAQVKIKSEQPNKEEIIEAIQEAFNQSKIENKEVIFGVVDKEVMIRFFRMPCIPKQERKNAVKFEAKRYIPFRIEEVVLGFQATEKKDESKLEVIFAASKKGHINNYLSLLREGGLNPVALEPACFSILRTLYFTNQIRKIETVAVVNIDSSAAEITVVRDGIPYLSRALSLNVSNIQPLLDSLLGEIQLSFDYYRRQFPGDNINRIIFYNEREGLKEVNESLSKELKIPVVKANPVEALSGRQYSSVEFSIVYGLALKGLIKSQLEIELYTEEKVVPEEKKRLVKATVASLLPALLALIALYLFMSRGVTELKAELNKTKQARINTDLVPFDASHSKIEETKIEISERLRILKRLISDRVYWTTKFDELPKFLPEGIWFEEIKLEEKLTEGTRYSQSYLILKGNVFLQDTPGEMELLNKFLIDLKKNGTFFEGFQEVKLTSVSQGESVGFEVTKFEISCQGESKQ